MTSSIFNRRDFLRSAGRLSAAGVAIPYWFTGSSARADESTAKNDRPHIAFIGVGLRGPQLAEFAVKDAEVVAVCDVDSRQAEKFKEKLGGKLDICNDYRKLLERNDIDAVINATPDHWHTAINIAAIKSGKDLYAEKPLTLTIDEGKMLRKVAAQSDRIVQIGTHHRSRPHFHLACELVRNGRIGKLKHVGVTLPYRHTRGGPFQIKPVPPELNWDVYQGQAPVHEYCKERTLYTFRWWYEYSGGMTTDWGAHWMDIAHWGMDVENTGPLEIEAAAIFPNKPNPNSYNTADRFVAEMEYPGDIKLSFCVVGTDKHYGRSSMDSEEFKLFHQSNAKFVDRERNGIMFTGDKGRVFANKRRVYGKPVEQLKDNPLPEDRVRLYESNDHMKNFIECMKTRKAPATSVAVHHRSLTPCHLCNIMFRLGRKKITWDPKAEQIVGDDEANGWLSREQRVPYVIES